VNKSKSEYIEIICLANSRKSSGRCIAGKSTDSGHWLRPVSSRSSMEISEEERVYSDGSMPQLLDIIQIPVLEAQPVIHQTENFIIDDRCHWAKTARYQKSELKALLDQPIDLWGAGASSYQGLNDRVADSSAYDKSLYLIEPERMTIIVRIEGAEFNNAKRKIRARFDYRGKNYTFPVTDPMIERKYFKKPDGEYSVSCVCICVSLGLQHSDGYCYKFVSAVFEGI